MLPPVSSNLSPRYLYVKPPTICARTVTWMSKPLSPAEVFLQHLQERVPRGSQRRVAELAGLSNVIFTRWFKGEREPNPTLKTLQSLASVLNMSVVDLLSPVARYPVDETAVRVSDEPYLGDGSRPLSIAVLAQEIAAGPAQELDEVTTGASYCFREEFIRRAGGLTNLSLLRVSRHPCYGSSMMPTIRPGSLVLVDRHEITQASFRQGCVYVVRSQTDEGVTVKRVWLAKNILVAWGDNPDSPRFPIPVSGTRLKEHLRGRVVWWSTEDL